MEQSPDDMLNDQYSHFFQQEVPPRYERKIYTFKVFFTNRNRIPYHEVPDFPEFAELVNYTGGGMSRAYLDGHWKGAQDAFKFCFLKTRHSLAEFNPRSAKPRDLWKMWINARLNKYYVQKRGNCEAHVTAPMHVNAYARKQTRAYRHAHICAHICTNECEHTWYTKCSSESTSNPIQFFSF